MILVTGAAGFIGANFVLTTLADNAEPIVSLDALTYAASLYSLESLRGDARHLFVRGDILDGELVRDLLQRHAPRAVVHFAAESHVDRSIERPSPFVETNIVGTFTLLDEARRYWSRLERPARERFRFLHVSTDEVYGSLGPDDAPFTEDSPYAPTSPYAASKAAADHLVRAYFHTYGLPTLVTHASNNYGPGQHTEKLIPRLISRALDGEPLPIYGDGENVRDWLYVIDHCEALRVVLARGRPGDSYNVGGRCEKTNLEVVNQVCAALEELEPRGAGRYLDLAAFVPDRPGHDRRYAIDASKLARLGWRARSGFAAGLRATAGWYLAERRPAERRQAA